MRPDSEIRKREFKCPLGLSNYDALCSKCEKKISNCGSGEHWKEWRRVLESDGCYSDDKCAEWYKKYIPNACGCGGGWYCVCGFEETFCMLVGNNIINCPFCGREITAEFSSMHKWMGKI